MPIIKPISTEQTWPLRLKIMYPEGKIDDVKLEKDAIGSHFGLFVDNELISVISFFQENNSGQFRKFCTDFDFQGKGFGTLLLNHLIEFAKNEKVNHFWCNARVSASDFYAKFGMKTAGLPYKGGDIDYVKMEMDF